MFGHRGGEPDVSVVQTTLRQARAAVDQYADPANRDRYAATLAECLWEAAAASDPGSDHQLAFVRAFSSFAADDNLDRVAGLLSGDIVLPGLAVDTDLRWSLLQSLVAAGRADDAAIETEFAADSTATGKRHRALVCAARPSAEAKAEAWDQMVTNDDPPNALLEATPGGFSRPVRKTFCVPTGTVTSPRWMTCGPPGPRRWRRASPCCCTRSADRRRHRGSGRRLPGAPGHQPSARRLVSEGRDATLRAQRARACDAGRRLPRSDTDCHARGGSPVRACVPARTARRFEEILQFRTELRRILSPCTLTACSAAASRSSSDSPIMTSEQLVSLGQRRQSAIIRAMMFPFVRGTTFDSAQRVEVGQPVLSGMTRSGPPARRWADRSAVHDRRELRPQQQCGEIVDHDRLPIRPAQRHAPVGVLPVGPSADSEDAGHR